MDILIPVKPASGLWEKPSGGLERSARSACQPSVRNCDGCHGFRHQRAGNQLARGANLVWSGRFQKGNLPDLSFRDPSNDVQANKPEQPRTLNYGRFILSGNHRSTFAFRSRAGPGWHDIHEDFGGQRQGGISTPKNHPYVFIFTGKSGEQHGYADGWQDEGVFLYTGEGQIGDMEFLRGNAAIRDHDKYGKELLLFEALGKSRPVRFLGRFACQSWDTFEGPDTKGAMRECIQFHLVKPNSNIEALPGAEAATPPAESLEELRKKAMEAAQPSQSKQWKSARAAYRARSKAVRDYVLARAGGRCELTGKPAPFLSKSGEPYLEVHHTRRLSDNGPDDPHHVAAICPSVHREIHFGQNGDELNRRLMERLKFIELG